MRRDERFIFLYLLLPFCKSMSRAEDMSQHFFTFLELLPLFPVPRSLFPVPRSLFPVPRSPHGTIKPQALLQ